MIDGDSENETDKCHLGKLPTEGDRASRRNREHYLLPHSEVGLLFPEHRSQRSRVLGQLWLSHLRHSGPIRPSDSPSQAVGVPQEHEALNNGTGSPGRDAEEAFSHNEFQNRGVSREERRKGVARAAPPPPPTLSQKGSVVQNKDNWLEASLLEEANRSPQIHCRGGGGGGQHVSTRVCFLSNLQHLKPDARPESRAVMTNH